MAFGLRKRGRGAAVSGNSQWAVPAVTITSSWILEAQQPLPQPRWKRREAPRGSSYFASGSVSAKPTVPMVPFGWERQSNWM
jgi:hypothetical protein